MADEIIKISGLTLNYGKTEALRGLNLSLSGGEIVGLLGANGSGKTTLMRVLSGLLTQWKGSVEIDGESDLWQAKRKICFLPADPFVEDGMSIGTAIRVYSELFPAYRSSLAEELFREFHLDLSARITTLSKGRRALAMFILYLSRSAKLYLLDEPFGGIDIKTREEMKEVLLSQAAPDKTFLISTHEITDTESVFDRIVIIREGQTVMNEEADALRARYGKNIRELSKGVL